MIFDRKSLLGMWNLRLLFWGTSALAIGSALALDDRPGWATAFLLAAVFTTPLITVPAAALLLLVLGAAVHGQGLSFVAWLQAYWLPAASWLALAVVLVAGVVWRATIEAGLNETADSRQPRRGPAPPGGQPGNAGGEGGDGGYRDPP